MSCGLPIVTFGTGGIKEVVTNKVNGYVAKYNVTEDLLVGVNYILNLNTKDLEKISTESRDKIINHFSLNKMVNEYIELYKSLLKK